MDLTMKLVNAGKASFSHAWTGYNTCASYDRQHWFRVPTSYEESSGVLSIQHQPEQVSLTTCDEAVHLWPHSSDASNQPVLTRRN